MNCPICNKPFISGCVFDYHRNCKAVYYPDRDGTGRANEVAIYLKNYIIVIYNPHLGQLLNNTTYVFKKHTAFQYRILEWDRILSSEELLSLTDERIENLALLK
jgi:hypothetical protein